MSKQEPEQAAPSGPSPEAMDRVALAAIEHVASGMRLGLGTGRAAEAFIRRLGERVRAGLEVCGVPTSERSAELASALGIELLTLEQVDRLDVAFDGADEVTPELDLTKGLGGALLRERVVAHAADRFVVLVTPDKRVDRLGSRTAIPIEVVPFAEAPVRRELGRLSGQATTRTGSDGKRYHTDNANLILDTEFGPIPQPAELDAAIRAIPGTVDTGLFLGMADVVLVGSELRVEELRRKPD